MKSRSVILALVGLLATGAVPAAEEGGGEAEPTVITSVKLTFDYQQKYAVFEEDVVVVDGDMRMTADKLAIWFDENNEITLIKAEGNVHITQEDKAAIAGVAVYEVATGKIVLTENPRLQQGLHYLEGVDKITYMRDADLLVAEPARLVIYPDEKGGGRTRMNLLGE